MNKQATPSINKPIFIVGAGHSGTSLLTDIITRERNIVRWSENNKTWIWGNAFNKSDILTSDDVTPRIKTHITKRFSQYLAQTNGERICDKTPKNCLRIPFILSIFPDAKIIHIVRDGRAVISSTHAQIEKKAYPLVQQLKVKLRGSSILDWYVFLPRLIFVLKKVLGVPTDYWGSKPPDWEKWSEDSRNIKLSKQWSRTVSIAREQGQKFSPQNYLEIHYEDLISSPRETIAQVVQFAEIENAHAIIDFAESKIDPSRNKKRLQSLDANDLTEIMNVIEPTLLNLGYK